MSALQQFVQGNLLAFVATWKYKDEQKLSPVHLVCSEKGERHCHLTKAHWLGAKTGGSKTKSKHDGFSKENY